MEPYPSSHPGYYLTPAQASLLRPFLSRVVLQNLSEDAQRAVPFEGRRLRGAALIVDVSGFTKLEILLNSRGRAGIEEFGETLHAIFDILVHLVVESGGLVLEFAGDALITFFADEDFADADDGALPAPSVTVGRARTACQEMMASVRAFPNIKLHGGVARGELRTVHLGCATAAMHGESRRGNLFVGDALNAAMALLEASEKGEILVEGMDPVRENELPPELEHMADLKWFKGDLGEADEHGDAPGAMVGDADSANGDGFTPGTEGGARRGAGASAGRMRQLMRKPSMMARAALSKAVERDRNEQVQNTWKLVEANLEANGVAFFRNIFRIAPGALQLFSFRDVHNLYETKELKAHGVKVLSTVGVAVAGLNDVAKLVPVLTMLGKKHLTYGVLPAHYDVVGQALLETLELGLGEHWTPAAKHAWGTVYGTVAGVMKSAAEEAQRVAADRAAKTNMLSAQVQEAMATTGVHYLQRYVLRHVVANEQQDAQRMSELRNIASLFACVPVPLDDVTGVIDLEAHNEAFAACHECVESLGGVVNQYLWDDKGVILKAAWGMLRPTRDDKKHAALCALQLVEALGDKTRVGVASGWAFTGLVGAEGMRLGMVMFGAESVTLAARLMMKATFGSALVSAEVKAATDRHIVYEGEGEPDLVLKGRNRNEPVCRPVKMKFPWKAGGGDFSASASALDAAAMLQRPTVQAPLRDALHSFVSGASDDRAASVLVVQGGGGCGKSILVEQLAAKVAEEAVSGHMPGVCSLVGALHHQITPYFVWRCFLHWALDNERDLHHLSPSGSAGRASPFGSTSKGMGLSPSFSSPKGNSLRYMSGGGSTRSKKFGDAELGSQSFNTMQKRSSSTKTSSGGDAAAAARSQGPQRLINDKKMMQRGFKRDVEGSEDAVALPDDFKIHSIILDRLRATVNGGMAQVAGSAVKGASAAEIAAAEMLFPSGDHTMETLLQGFSDEDWDDAHDLIKQIIVSVVTESEQPLMLILDDAHYCDPTSWNLIEWLSSPAAAATAGKLMMVVVGLSPPEAPNHHVARIHRMTTTGHLCSAAPNPIHIDALTDDEAKKLVHSSLGVLTEQGETVSPILENHILEQTQGSPRDIVLLADLLCRQNRVLVSSTGQHDLVRKAPNATSKSSSDGDASQVDGSGGSSRNSTSKMDLPDGLWAALVERIDMLSAAEADLLKCAAILGVEFSVELLVQIMEHSLPVMLGLLESIEAQGLLKLLEPGVYKFVYPLQAQVAVSLMMTSQQEEMHLLVASVYEMEASDLVPFTAERAMHYARAGPEHAVDAAKLYAAAAEQADAAGAIALAGNYLKEVIAIGRSNAAVAPQLPVYLARAAANLMSEALDEVGGASPENIQAMRTEVGWRCVQWVDPLWTRAKLKTLS